MSAAAAVALKNNGSRAVGAGGMSNIPFQNGLTSLTAARKVLRNNGAPMADVQVVSSVDAYSNMLNLNVIQKANEAGTDAERRSGVIRSQFGLNAVREDANIADHTSGAGTGYTLNGNHAKGATTLAVTGGTVNVTGIKLGDIITIAGDTQNSYCVGYAPGTTPTLLTQAALTSTSGNIYIGNPGLMKAITSGAAITIKSGTTQGGVTGYTPSFAFERHCAVGVIRPPIMPAPNPFYSILSTITDKFGYTYLFGEANQQFQVTWFLWVAYGFAVTQREYVVPIVGE
jgi:hypothetical protein